MPKPPSLCTRTAFSFLSPEPASRATNTSSITMTVEFNFSSITFSLIALLAGLSLLVAGGEALVAGAVRLAGRLGMSALMIGLTVVAFGTSMPEFFVSLSAALQNKPDIMLGNVTGFPGLCCFWPIASLFSA